ncbi:hypothetical protein Mnod_8281 (plasmid) [Methylobacterium nodulans ORS 2060]|uniref:Uncharacterized protein n=1 Tax=Methylobacterium nodulans (strain LMG 21967 / CNCM I-2342 / ORS 2060) TaxID=460265 RepID=B8IVI8_METNO|nr:hypothetical protein Mnod_8281 [Methylobacterium nodulans ORS 2060]
MGQGRGIGGARVTCLAQYFSTADLIGDVERPFALIAEKVLAVDAY